MKLVDVLKYEEKCDELKKWEEDISQEKPGYVLFTKEADEYISNLSSDKLLALARFGAYINKRLAFEDEYSQDLERELKKAKEDRQQYVSHLESEVSRLKKAVHEMYNDIKLKGMKFITNAKPEKDVMDIFLNVFENYLK